MKFNQEEKKSIKYFKLEIKGTKDKEWYTLDYSKLEYTKDTTTEVTYCFDSFWSDIEENNKPHWEHQCFETYRTMFKNRRVLIEDRLFDKKSWTENKNGKVLHFRAIAIEQPNASIKRLMEELSNQDFIEYLKDNNISLQLGK